MQKEQSLRAWLTSFLLAMRQPLYTSVVVVANFLPTRVCRMGQIETGVPDDIMKQKGHKVEPFAIRGVCRTDLVSVSSAFSVALLLSFVLAILLQFASIIMSKVTKVGIIRVQRCMYPEPCS